MTGEGGELLVFGDLVITARAFARPDGSALTLGPCDLDAIHPSVRGGRQ
jgi:hypothetical protein